MNRKRVKLSVIVLSLASVIFFYGVYLLYFNYKNAVYLEFADLCLKDSRLNTSLDKNASPLDHLRHCLHKNSWHRIDDEYYALAKQGRKAFAQRVLDHLKGVNEARPHMECSKRAAFLYRTYKALGYKTESIVVVKNTDQFPDHVVVRVLNKQTGKYELQDPDFDVHFKLKETGERLDIFSLLRLTSDEVTPCAINGDCGWDVPTIEGRKPLYSKAYYGVAFLDYNDETGPLVYNPKKFDPFKDKKKSGQVMMSYCEKRPRHCEKTINVLESDLN